jgi:hypothetical protein
MKKTKVVLHRRATGEVLEVYHNGITFPVSSSEVWVLLADKRWVRMYEGDRVTGESAADEDPHSVVV